MIGWAEIVLLVLKIANAIMGQINRQQLIQSGRDAVIAEETASILRKTQVGKAIMEKVDAMSDDDIDAEFARLARLRAQRRDG